MSHRVGAPQFTRTRQLGFLALGLACTGIGFANFFIPLMPSTVFLLVAVWAFGKSSPRLESWLLYHPMFGEALRDWREHRAMSSRVKVSAISALWLFAGGSAAYLLLSRDLPAAAGALAAVAAMVTWFLATRPAKKQVPAQ